MNIKDEFQADPEGIHLRNGERVGNYAVYEIWNGDHMICAVHGGCSASMAAHICKMFNDDEASKYLDNGQVLRWYPKEG